MYSLNSNSDNLAAEFARLIKSSNPTEKNSPDAIKKLASEKNVSHTADEESDINSKIESILVEDPGQNSDLASDSLDDSITSIDSYASTRKDYILNGLNKISEDLRRKDQVFAADVVTATALEIKSDMEKESIANSNVTNSLKKIATELRDGGDSFAADLVFATINKFE
jgi:hypothetical protein